MRLCGRDCSHFLRQNPRSSQAQPCTPPSRQGQGGAGRGQAWREDPAAPQALPTHGLRKGPREARQRLRTEGQQTRVLPPVGCDLGQVCSSPGHLILGSEHQGMGPWLKPVHMNSAWDSEVCGLSPARCISPSGDRNRDAKAGIPASTVQKNPPRRWEAHAPRLCLVLAGSTLQKDPGVAARGGARQARPPSPAQGRAGPTPPVQGGCLGCSVGGGWGQGASASGGLFLVEELLKVRGDPSPPNLENHIFPFLTFLTGCAPGRAGRAQVQDLQSSTRNAGSAPNRGCPEPSECTSGPWRHGVNLSLLLLPRDPSDAAGLLLPMDGGPWLHAGPGLLSPANPGTDRQPICPRSATDASPSPCGLGRRQSDQTRKVLVHAE